MHIPTFFQSVKLHNKSKFEPHSLRKPGIINVNVNDAIQNRHKGNCVWTKNDIKRFLESVFNDNYICALLFWEIVQDLQLDVIPIKGGMLNN